VGGSTFTAVAPAAISRVSAEGPGTFSAMLTTRVPASGAPRRLRWIICPEA
jgi:hypothetical protein